MSNTHVVYLVGFVSEASWQEVSTVSCQKKLYPCALVARPSRCPNYDCSFDLSCLYHMSLFYLVIS